MFKKGDVIKVIEEYVSYPYDLKYGSIHVVNDVSKMTGNINVGVCGQYWNASRFVLMVESSPEVFTQEKFAQAFNMWQDDFCNNPQAYELAGNTAMRHLKEKLDGKEPSYGAVAAQIFQQYLTTLENQNV